jgi:hypothetical protein
MIVSFLPLGILKHLISDMIMLIINGNLMIDCANLMKLKQPANENLIDLRDWDI